MTTAAPPGYSRLFASGLFLATEAPAGHVVSSSRSATPTPLTAAPQTPLFDLVHSAATRIDSATLSLTPKLASGSRSPRRPKLAALRTHSVPHVSGTGVGSAPSSPRMLRRRKSSVTLAHNPMAAIKSPTRSAGMSGKAMQALGSLSPGKERRTCSLDLIGEGAARARRVVSIARKPPPTAPLPALPLPNPFTLPTLTLNTSFPSPMSLSPALTPSPNVLPAPTPIGLHKPTLAVPRLARSPLVPVSGVENVGPGYFDVPIMRGSSPVMPESANTMEIE